MRKIEGLACILLIDDDKITNYIQAREIRKAGIDVHIQETTSGEEALDYIRKTGKFKAELNMPQPGIIILDLNMPGMTGWDFMEEYKRLSVSTEKKQVVVILTTSVNPDDKIQAEAMPEISEFIRKPLQKEKLNAIIKEYYGG